MMDYRGEVKHLREKCAALEHELCDYKNALNEEKQKSRRLRRALPTLPDPPQLYKNIVARCYEFYECTKKISMLNSRVRNLHTSTADFKDRLHELELLEISCDRMRLEFLLVRCQIRIVFSLPPLLIAKGTISAVIWDTWMAREQLNDEDDPLLMDPGIMETAVTEQLQLLEGLQRNLSDLRATLLEESRQDLAAFQESVLEKLRQIQSSLNGVVQQRNNLEMMVDELHMEPLAEGEGAPREAHEQEIIHENAEFMEEIQDLGADQEEAQPSNPPERGDQEREDEEPRNPPVPENPALASRRREIEQEIHQFTRDYTDGHPRTYDGKDPAWTLREKKTGIGRTPSTTTQLRYDL
ncbi:hypothetical protein GCK32_011200 [Trichostrongylus colubriformis]|uniref:Uncharacterized protein n=1 Tax=Trichostrongylus colubriformis TaxID=6319 RepID=A0AAN8EW80_TRICO